MHPALTARQRFPATGGKILDLVLNGFAIFAFPEHHRTHKSITNGR